MKVGGGVFSNQTVCSLGIRNPRSEPIVFRSKKTKDQKYPQKYPPMSRWLGCTVTTRHYCDIFMRSFPSISDSVEHHYLFSQLNYQLSNCQVNYWSSRDVFASKNLKHCTEGMPILPYLLPYFSKNY